MGKKYAVTNGISGGVDLDKKPVTANWQRLQYGMFIHWGLYSVYGGEVNGEPVREGYSEQIQMWAGMAEAEYVQAAAEFTGEGFDPDAICRLALDAGMRYIVITSKHHDGFAMFDTATTDYNVVKQTPFGRDPLKMLAEACERHGLGFGVYFSLVDWHLGHDFDLNNNNPIPVSMEPAIEAQLTELMTNYGPIVEVWFDMSSPTPGQSAKFAGIVRKYQPHAAINSRIWNNTGDFRTLGDNQIPAQTLEGPWQTPASIYRETWGYRKWQAREGFEGKVRDLIKGLVSVRARGGNYLLNIGPRGDGSVVPFEREVLEAVGDWLKQYPDSVIGATATRFGGQPWGEVTVNGRDLYLHLFSKPENGQVVLPGLGSTVAEVTDGDGNTLDWVMSNCVLTVDVFEQQLDVIKVRLESDLTIVPEQTLKLAAGDEVHAEITQIESGYGFADRGNYNTLTETTLRHSVFFLPEESGEVLVRLTGTSTDSERRYKVTVADRAVVVSAGDLLREPIGPFAVTADHVYELSVVLDEPAFAEADLGLEVTGVSLSLS
ncbi:Alpha-L-fucosidase [Lentibacillus sp. JNUCC-1]|uniref:alpha-L-fucosidase n=1 Tax=Lentibacillus sp. JNUCC-1 TaxID=2654513 RepID=UPI001322AFEF|nr:alpha-L-fucosidase [Lentibacillus sp. JNUCC-1]MUV37254.1 Alpha-L-fucosidase [Lentibacillus sp. JNUCC-1]